MGARLRGPGEGRPYRRVSTRRPDDAGRPVGGFGAALAATVCKDVGRDITPIEWRTYIPSTAQRKVC